MTTQPNSPILTRLAQILAGLNFALLLALVVLYLFFFRPPDIGFEDLAQIFLSTLNIVIYTTLGVLILTQQPRHIIGWLFLILAFALTLFALSFPFSGQGGAIIVDSAIVIGLSNWVSQMTWFPWFYIPLSLMLLFFPDGHLPTKRWWPVAAAAILSLIIFEITNAISPTWESEGEIISNPFGISGSEAFLDGLMAILFPLVLIGLFGSLAAVVVRFRRSQGIERAQMKWLVYMAIIGIFTLVFLIIFAGEDNQFFSAFPILLPVLFAIPMGLGILRYRLWDIDIIIRRTLVYGTLTAILLALYFALVLALQSVVTAVGGQQSPIIIVISTLVIAALFNPLRRRYNAAETLAGFSITAREEVDLENLSVALLRVVDNTMQPESVSVWLKERSE